MAWFWQWKQKYFDALDERNTAREERNAADVQVSIITKQRDGARDELEQTRTQKAQVQSAFQNAEKERLEAEKSRDWFKDEWEKGKQQIDALKKDQRDKDALCAEKNELLQQVQDLEADVERLNEKVEATNTANRNERIALIKERDDARSECGKLTHKYRRMEGERDEAVDRAKRAERCVEERKELDARRPIIEVELYESTQGPKRTPCMRFVGREGDRTVVAVSPPQGTRDEKHARERIAFLSRARWVIFRTKDADGKVTYPVEDDDGDNQS